MKDNVTTMSTTHSFEKVPMGFLEISIASGKICLHFQLIWAGELKGRWGASWRRVRSGKGRVGRMGIGIGIRGRGAVLAEVHNPASYIHRVHLVCQILCGQCNTRRSCGLLRIKQESAFESRLFIVHARKLSTFPSFARLRFYLLGKHVLHHLSLIQ